MRLSKVKIKNFKSIKDSGYIEFTDNLFVLAGQNESGKSSILEALKAFEDDESNKDFLNFDLESNEDNLIQEIECCFDDLNEEFYNEISEDIFDLYISEIGEDSIDIFDFIDITALKKIDQFKLTKTFDFNDNVIVSYLELNKEVLGIIKSSIKSKSIVDGDPLKVAKEKRLDIDFYEGEIAEIFFSYKPPIILFNDFSTLLPDKILLSQIEDNNVEGQAAVKNLRSLLIQDFPKIANRDISQKISLTESETESISFNFREDWQQKIFNNNSVGIKFHIENNGEGEPEISFFVETKSKELLAPRKRSKGMIWFLSLWLELKAKENENNMILLFDEPGLHLHVKANQDMLKVFNKLVLKGHQLIYSTHSPSLIETDKLHNIGLVINTEKKGTLVENLTTSKIDNKNKQDALQPIAEAMGMEPLKDFSILKKKNVLLEGLSDFWYLKGMAKLLNKKVDYEFVPGIGVKNNKIYPLISFCIGYGLEWLLVMDNGPIPQKEIAELEKNIFNDNKDELNKHVLLIQEKEIEDLFEKDDIYLIDPSISRNTIKKSSEIIGSKRKMLFAKMFYQSVVNGKIQKNQISPSTIKKFENIFKWIDEGFKN